MVTTEEWLEVLSRVYGRIAFFGVIHYWPNHRYDFLNVDPMGDQVADADACDVLLRTTPLNQGRLPDTYFDEPTVEGFVQIDVPKISALSARPRLVCSSMGIRAAATRPGLPSPVPLFEAIKKEFKRRVRGPMVDPENGRVMRHLGYTNGALALYDAGYDLAIDWRSPAEHIVGGKDDVPMPIERWILEDPDA